MSKTVAELRGIVFMGGSLVINANEYDVSEIKSVVFIAKQHNAKVYIKKANILSSQVCQSIAFIGGKEGNVTFDFTE